MRAKFLLLPLLCVFSGLTAFGRHAPNEVPVYSKKISRQIPVTDNFSLSLVNKSGDMTIKNWDKDEVSITVTVASYANDIDRAKKRVEDIDLLSEVSDDNIRVSVLDKASATASGFFTKVGQLINESNLEVNFEIFVPDKLNYLNIDNSLGDIWIDELNCPSSFAISYCDFKCSSISKSTEISAKFSDIILGTCNDANVKLQNSTLDVSKLRTLVIPHSSFSKIKIQHADSVFAYKFNSGSMRLQFVQKVNIVSSFSGIEINELKLGGKITYAFANAEVWQLDESATSLSVTGKFGDAKIRTANALSYQLNATVDGGNINANESEFAYYSFSPTEKKSLKILNAKTLENANTAVIKLNVVNGTITMQQLP